MKTYKLTAYIQLGDKACSGEEEWLEDVQMTCDEANLDGEEYTVKFLRGSFEEVPE